MFPGRIFESPNCTVLPFSKCLKGLKRAEKWSTPTEKTTGFGDREQERIWPFSKAFDQRKKLHRKEM